MKVWNNPFKAEERSKCICDKEEGTINVRPEIAKRNVWFMVLGLMALIVIIIIVGVRDVRIWPLIIFEAIFSAPFVVVTILKLSQGHTLKCASRYASLKTY